jgi:hypothetical protein
MQQSALPEALAARFKGQIATAYLTLSSIIQGVLISALVVRVEGAYTSFGAADWLLGAATLLAFLLIWHEYLMQALAFVWLPTLLDSLIPFTFLVVGLFLAHFVYGNQRAWLLAAAARFAVGIAAWGTSHISSRAHAEENIAVVGVLAQLSMARLALTVFPAAVFLAAWALYDVLGLGQIPVPVAAGALILIASRIAVTVPYWNRVLAHVRGEIDAGSGAG